MKYEHRYLFVEILEGVLLVMLGVATMLRTEPPCSFSINRSVSSAL